MPARTRIKICGLTRAADVRVACDLGVDALGFVCVAGSARQVEPAQLPALVAAMTPWVTPVLLFVDELSSRVEAALAQVPHALLQFHGDQSPVYCASFGRPYLRAVSMARGVDLLDFEARFATATALLADTPPRALLAPEARYGAALGAGTALGHFGGSGRSFDWGLVPAASLRRLPLVLAGGLDANNVAEAIAKVRPYAVDVSSGVESARGVKSVAGMRRFVASVRAVDAQTGAA